MSARGAPFESPQPGPKRTLVGVASAPRESDRAGSVYEDPAALDRLVEEAISAASLDFVSPGDTVLVKPNWVSHRNESGAGLTCLVTHPELILAVIRNIVCLARKSA